MFNVCAQRSLCVAIVRPPKRCVASDVGAALPLTVSGLIIAVGFGNSFVCVCGFGWRSGLRLQCCCRAFAMCAVRSSESGSVRLGVCVIHVKRAHCVACLGAREELSVCACCLFGSCVAAERADVVATCKRTCEHSRVQMSNKHARNTHTHTDRLRLVEHAITHLSLRTASNHSRSCASACFFANDYPNAHKSLHIRVRIANTIFRRLMRQFVLNGDPNE